LGELVGQLAGQVLPLTLVGCRLSGLFVFAPMLASMAIPVRVKVLLCAVLSVAAWPLVQATVPGGAVAFEVAAGLDVFTLLLLCAGEVLVGLVIGVLALLPIAAAQLAGVLIGQQMGLSMATVFNPSTESESDVTGEIVMHLALAGFLALGGFEVLFLCVLKTFAWVPVGALVGVPLTGMAGGGLGWAPLALTTGLMNSGFDLALRVAAPVIGLVLVETMATAMLIKTIPQMNIMVVGFGLKVLIGLLALVAAVRVMDSAIVGHIAEAGRQTLLWSGGDGPAAVDPAMGAGLVPAGGGVGAGAGGGR
jgi:flagellar biosynthetic protein FliR